MRGRQLRQQLEQQQKRTLARRARLAPSPLADTEAAPPPVDYAMALEFITRVKHACAPSCFPAFLDILMEYHAGRRTVRGVYDEASALFNDPERGCSPVELPAVLESFQRFLPADC